MTTNDTSSYPAGEPDDLWELYREVLDLVDEEVDAITDEEVDDRLRQVLTDTGYLDADRGEISAVLGIARGAAHLDLAGLVKRLSDSTEWDEAACLLAAAQHEAAMAQARAKAAWRQAQTELARAAQAAEEAAEARRHADEITAGVDAYVDQEIDRAAAIIAEAQEQAARIVAEAEQRAERITATIQAGKTPSFLTVELGDGTTDAAPARVMLVGAGGVGKTSLLAAIAAAGEGELPAVRDDDWEIVSWGNVVSDLRGGLQPKLWRVDLTSRLMLFDDLLTDLDQPLPAVDPILTPNCSPVVAGEQRWSEVVRHVKAALQRWTSNLRAGPLLIPMRRPFHTVLRKPPGEIIELVDLSRLGRYLDRAPMVESPTNVSGSCRSSTPVRTPSEAHVGVDLVPALDAEPAARRCRRVYYAFNASLWVKDSGLGDDPAVARPSADPARLSTPHCSYRLQFEPGRLRFPPDASHDTEDQPHQLVQQNPGPVIVQILLVHRGDLTVVDEIGEPGDGDGAATASEVDSPMVPDPVRTGTSGPR